MTQAAKVRNNEPGTSHLTSPLRIVTFDTTQTAEKAEGVCIPILPPIIHTAREIGRIRTALHNGNRKSFQDLGSKKNLRIDYLGALGELLVIDALLTAGLHPTNFSLCSHPTPCGPDFQLNGFTFNVKTIPPSDRRQFVYVNEAQRLHPKKRVHYYLPIAQFADRTARILAPVLSVLVADWPLRTGHSPYRSCAVDELTPLYDIQELVG